MNISCNRSYLFVFAALILFSFTGCGLIEKMAIRTTGSILGYSVDSLYEEEDIIIAEHAVMANLKLLEGLIKGDPGNRELLVLAAQGFTGYALGFVEDKDPQRAKLFYKRGREYGLRALGRKRPLRNLIDLNVDALSKALKSCGKADVPALFWAANAWGNWINLSRDSVVAISQMGKVEMMMTRVLELDEDYYYGGVHIYFSSYYGGRSAMFGGDAEKAKSHFDRFVEISDGRFLLGYYLYAKYYAVQTQDPALFRELLETVINAAGEQLDEQRLVNEIAKGKAKNLLSDIESYF